MLSGASVPTVKKALQQQKLKARKLKSGLVMEPRAVPTMAAFRGLDVRLSQVAQRRVRDGLFAKGGEKTVKKLLDAIDAWEFGYDLSEETLLQMQDEIPASIAAFGDAYRLACLEGRLGN